MTEAESNRWLIFRKPEGGEAFGRILEDNVTDYVLEIDEASMVLAKDRRQQREVKATSLDLLHLRDPEAIAVRFAANPVETVVAVLADRPVDRTKDQIIDQLQRFGIAMDEKGWKGLQTKIAGHPNIERRSAAPIRYRWREATVTREEPEVLLSRALTPSTPKDLAERARRELAVLHAAFQLNPTQQALAALAEVPGVVLPRWSDVTIEGLDDRSADRLLVRAAQSRSWEFITPVALDPDHPTHAAHAAQLLDNAPIGQREQQLAAALDRLAAPGPGGGPVSAERLLARLPLIERVIGEHAPPAIVSRLLRLAFALDAGDAGQADEAGDPADGQERTDPAVVQRWAVLTTARASESTDSMQAALDEVAPSDDQRAAVAAVLAKERFTPEGARLRWLAVLSRSGETSGVELADRQWWEGVSLADLPVLDADPDLGPVIRDGLGQELLVALAVEGSLADDASALAQVLALPDWMLELVPIESVVSAADRVDPKSALGRAIEAIRLSS